MAEVKDTKVLEKEKLVIKGEVFADGFRDRETGKSIAETGLDDWTETMNDKIAFSDGEVVIKDDTKINGNLTIDGLSKLKDENGNQLIPTPNVSGTYVLKSVDGVLTWVEELTPTVE